MVGPRHDTQPKVFVTGDLFLDSVIVGLELGGVNRIPRRKQAVGGSAFNAALAFKREGFNPIVFGSVGDDTAGDMILRELENQGISQLITRDKDRPTGQCDILHFIARDELRTIYYEAENANTYDVAALCDAVGKAALGPDDYLFSPLYILERMNWQIDACRPFMNELSATPARLIIDLVPHRLYEFCDSDTIRGLTIDDPWLIVGSFETFSGLTRRTAGLATDEPTKRDCEDIARTFKAKYYACRYGAGNISNEILFSSDIGRQARDLIVHDTGYAWLSPDQTRGFGDLLTARAVRALAGSAVVSQPLYEGGSSDLNGVANGRGDIRHLYEIRAVYG